MFNYNQIKTVFLLGSLSGIFLLLGGLLGGSTGLAYAFILALIMNFVAYFYSDKIVLRMYKAQPLDRAQYEWIYETVGDLARKMNLPMPQLWLVNHPWQMRLPPAEILPTLQLP